MAQRKRQKGFAKFRRNGIWYLRGTVRGVQVYETTGTPDEDVAEAVRIKKEGELLHQSVFGKAATYKFEDAVVSYLESAPRSDATKGTVARLLAYFKGRNLAEIDQLAVDGMYKALVPPGKVHPKITLVTALSAILEHAARRKMCPRPMLEKPKAPPTSTPFLYPSEATALVKAAVLHLRPLLVFLISVGCRPEEALKLLWRNVDLRGGQATLTLGKVNQKEWVVTLRPVALRALASLPHREGRVFRTWLAAPDQGRGPLGPGYKGGRFAGAWETACGAAKLPGQYVERIAKDGSRVKRFKPEHNPYTTRHTFATWYRCAYKDLADLRDEIGWTTTRMGERYGKKMSRTYEKDVLAWWNDEVDLGLAEVEEVSCKIRAMTNAGLVAHAPKKPRKSAA